MIRHVEEIYKHVDGGYGKPFEEVEEQKKKESHASATQP